MNINITQELWTCPKCKRKFAKKNQPHSCGKYTVEDFLKGKNKSALTLFNEFIDKLKSVGEFVYAPTKNRIGFQVRMIFAAINKIENDSIEGHLILARKSESTKFFKIVYISQSNYIHRFKISALKDFDEEFLELLKESYEVGQQKHLKTK